MPKEKKLKIQAKYFPRRWKEVVFPEIKLAGKWLQDNGFSCGQQVSIIYRKNKIIITLLKTDPLPAAAQTSGVIKNRRKAL